MGNLVVIRIISIIIKQMLVHTFLGMKNRWEKFEGKGYPRKP